MATAKGKNAEQLVKDTVTRTPANQARFIAGVEGGIEQANRGEFVEHQDVSRYISTEKIVEILHIWHGAQDWR